MVRPVPLERMARPVLRVQTEHRGRKDPPAHRVPLGRRALRAIPATMAPRGRLATTAHRALMGHRGRRVLLVQTASSPVRRVRLGLTARLGWTERKGRLA